MSETWKIEQGTKVRTVYGQDAELLTDWYEWEASVTVITSGGRVKRYHPTKVFIGGDPLPYVKVITDEPCTDCYRGFPCSEHPVNIYS